MKIGDWVEWCGSVPTGLQGIVVDTRKSYPLDNGAIKVVWYKGLLGSYEQVSGGSWQQEKNLKVLSSMEQDNENR